MGEDGVLLPDRKPISCMVVTVVALAAFIVGFSAVVLAYTYGR